MCIRDSILLSQGIVLLESIDLTGVPTGYYKLICLPMKIARCEGVPARAILLDEAIFVGSSTPTGNWLSRSVTEQIQCSLRLQGILYKKNGDFKKMNKKFAALFLLPLLLTSACSGLALPIPEEPQNTTGFVKSSQNRETSPQIDPDLSLIHI